MNSDYNNFVARVALEVVDGSRWKHQLRVKSAGSTFALMHQNGLVELSSRTLKLCLYGCLLSV